MKITFNELGVVTSTITDDESYRQGNVGNTLTAVFEGKNANNYIATFSYTRSDGSTIARLPMSIESSNSYKYTFNEVWFTELDGITTLTIYLYDSRNNIIANGQLQFNIEKTDFSEITNVTPDELNAWIAQLASKLDINSTQYIRFYPTIKDSNYSELPVGTTFGVKETINTGLEEKIQFYQVNSRQGLNSLSAIRVQDFTKTSGGFALANTLYTGRFLATPNAINIPYGLYLGWKDSNNNYYFIVNGKFYTTDVNLTSGSVSVVEDAVTKLTQLTNLLVDENMQIRGQIYKGMGTPTENEVVLTRGEIKEEFVEQVKTGNKPRAYGINSLNEQTMYEIRVDRFPSTVMLRDANGNSYVADPTDDAHVANKGYVDGEITTLRDESMNYTDEEVTHAIVGLKDDSGKIRSDLLPSYVDDVVEYDTYDDFPLEGKTGKIYIDLSTNSTYRWSGSQYFPLNVKGVEELERVTPTDIVAIGNTIKLYHDSNEITGQENPVIFKTINGEPIIGDGDIEVNGATYNYDISPATAVVGTLTSEIVTALSDTNATITRAGELYRYSDKSDSEYLTYVHASIDTSQADKPAVMRAIRINLTTYAWELLDYDLTSEKEYITKKETVNRIKDLTYSKNLIITSFEIPETINDVTITACGKNLLDTSESSVRGDEAILNDNGQPIYDYNSKYFLKKIAVIPDENLYINFGAQRIYQYDINGNWLRRTPSFSLVTEKVFGKWTVPSDCYYIQIQYSNDSKNLSNAQIEVGGAETFYEPHRENNITINKNSIVPIKNLLTYENFTRLYSNFNITFSISYDIPKNIVILPECKTYDLWEPSYTTDEYQAPIGRDNVKVAITYYEFLEKYYDIYLGTNEDGYKVVKRSLGHDASHRYEVMEYDFIPQNYNRIILLSAGMNACELPAEWGLAYLIKSIMENHNEDEGLKYIYENVRIKVIPVINAWGFDQTPKSYLNYNQIRINKNFNYKDSWDTMGSNEYKGNEPDSEEEVLILKKWLNENANLAELYIDCHTDPDANTPYNVWAGFSTGLYETIYPYIQNVIIPYYKNKGLDPDNQLINAGGTSSYKIYPKTQYSYDICKIPAIMIEMCSNTTALGSDPSIMNEDAEIRYYVLLLRAFILLMLKRKEIILVKDEK